MAHLLLFCDGFDSRGGELHRNLYAGVLQTLPIRRSGFPGSMTLN